MAFSDLQLKAASESAAIAINKNCARLGVFSKNFSDAAAQPCENIAVCVLDLSSSAEFSPGVNDYGTGTNEIGGNYISLNQHYCKSISLSDRDMAETGVRFASDVAYALADTLTRGINEYVFGLFNSTNVPLSADAPTTKATIAGLYGIASDNNIAVDNAVVLCNPTLFATILANVDYSVVGNSDVATGRFDGLYGFKSFVAAPYLPDGVKGCIVDSQAVGIAGRYLYPGTEGSYPQAWSAMDDNTGLTIGYRRFMDLSKGANMLAADALFGAKILLPNKAVRLV